MPDSTDGATLETGLTITQPDVRLSKNGAAFAQKSAAQTLSHMENGQYSCNLSTTDTNTVGRLRVAVFESGALIWWQDFQVVEEAVYDLLYESGATGQVTVASMGANVVTASALASDAVTEIQSGLATAAALATVDSEVGVIDGIVDSLLAAVNALENLSQAQAQAAAAAALTAYDPPTAAELVSEINAVQADIAALNDLDASTVETAAGAALTAYDPPTKAELDAAILSVTNLLDVLVGRTVMYVGIAQGAGTGNDTLELAAGQITEDDQMNDLLIVLMGGAGSPDERPILDTVLANEEIQVYGGAWVTPPDNTTVYAIVSN